MLLPGYIGAVAGRESRDFGLENSLQSNMPPVYVPYTVFDQVITISFGI